MAWNVRIVSLHDDEPLSRSIAFSRVRRVARARRAQAQRGGARRRRRGDALAAGAASAAGPPDNAFAGRDRRRGVDAPRRPDGRGRVGRACARGRRRRGRDRARGARGLEPARENPVRYERERRSAPDGSCILVVKTPSPYENNVIYV